MQLLPHTHALSSSTAGRLGNCSSLRRSRSKGRRTCSGQASCTVFVYERDAVHLLPCWALGCTQLRECHDEGFAVSHLLTGLSKSLASVVCSSFSAYSTTMMSASWSARNETCDPSAHGMVRTMPDASAALRPARAPAVACSSPSSFPSPPLPTSDSLVAHRTRGQTGHTAAPRETSPGAHARCSKLTCRRRRCPALPS